MTPKFHTLTVNDVRRETEDTVSIALSIPDEFKTDYAYRPGQYLTFKLQINGEEIRRSYSLCTAPFEGEWRVAVKQVPNGAFSTFANKELKVGDQLEVMTPTGHFAVTTEKSNKKSYVFFAAGSGITPVLAMLKSILHEEPESDVTLFYGNKGFYSIIFREEIEAIKNQYMDRIRVIHILSRESLGNKVQKGRIDREKVSALYSAFLHDLEISGVYVCGPEEMIHAVKDEMATKGVDEHNIHFELFNTEKKSNEQVEEYKGPDIHSTVTIIIDDEELVVPLDTKGENILDAGQKAGADLPFACKGGVCCTCKAKVLEGTVRMEVNYALEQDELDAGYILTCQAHPTSEKVVVSFDE